MAIAVAAPAPAGPRERALTGALVAAVVVLLGFGSGIGALVGGNDAPTTAPLPADGLSTDTVATDVAEIPPATESVSLVPVAHTTAATTPSSSDAPAVVSAAAEPAPQASTTETSAPPPASSAPAAASCAPGAADAFMTHFRAAHLEESPGQQVADILDVDQYTLTHTVLVENMLAGLLNPFMKHFNSAHLEESPGQQVADILDVDQYTVTHTVLVENMLSGTGACSH